MYLLTLTTPTWLILLTSHLTAAHVKLVQPIPYGAASLNTNPLLTTGADYPCKLRPGGYDITHWNTIPLATPQTLAFQGQATHGGGSCQISLTRDTPPTADSVFKVIKSIEGGCPSTNPGNVGTDPFGYGADEFTYTIPETVGAGNFTLAWTWFNKIGEREMYMNCAPVSVVPAAAGGKKKQRRRRGDGLDALPVMFRANSGNGCQSPESGSVLKIPEVNLGEVVQRIGDEVLVPPVGSCGGETGAAAASSSPVSTAVAAPPASSASLPVYQASPAPAAPLASAPPPASEAPILPSTPPAAAPSAPSTPAGMTTRSCLTPGKSVCAPDGKSWGTCMENHQVIYQPVAVGTKCDLALGVEVPA